MSFERELIVALSSCSASLMTIVLLLFTKRRSGQIRHTDCFVFLTMILLSIYALIDGDNLDYADVCKYTTLLSVYIFVRILPQSVNKWLIRMVVVVGLIESITALSQLCGIFNSNHPHFLMTGHLSNPGPLGGLMALSLLPTIWLIKEEGDKNHRLILIIIGLLQLVTLILTESRAALLAFFVGVLCLIPIKKYYIHHKVRVVSMVLITFICLIPLSAYLYNLKRTSVEGRLLIWSVCAEMITENPILGKGIGSFPNSYMLSQSRYIEQNSETASFDSASDNLYAFNEPLHLIIETGVIGVLLLGALFLVLFESKNGISRSVLFAWIAFSCFSYPADVFLLLIIFILFFATLPSKEVMSIDVLSIVKIPGVMTLSIILLFSLHVFSIYKNLQNGEIDCRQAIKENAWLKNNESFSMVCMIPWCNKSMSIEDYCELKQIIPSTVTYNALAKYLIRISRYDEAEEILLKAVWMAPNQLKAKYNLWKLYVDNGCESDAIKMANIILETKVKVTNSFTINAISDIKKYLNDVEKK